MKTIKLTKNKQVKIDDCDFEILSKIKWYACSCKGKWYARTSIGKNQKEYLHRIIMGTIKGQKVKFLNNDTLDCRKKNLCVATEKQIAAKRRKLKIGSSKYKGVCFDKRNCVKKVPWMAYIKENNKFKTIGHFKSEKLAAIARDKEAKLRWGSFAELNFK